MTKAYIALGSNMGDRELYLRQALQKINSLSEMRITKVSSVYETAPIGVVKQPPFLNMVVAVNTEESPMGLLAKLQNIENELGRVRTERWGPRTIDLDILLYKDQNVEQKDLHIPHPRMHERAFVLVPLAEIEPDIHVPVVNQTAEDILASLPDRIIKGVQLWTQREQVGEYELFEN